MRKSITLRPRNSLILIMDYHFGELPKSMNGNLVESTDSCVAVGTLSELDGDTTVVITDERVEKDKLERLVFDGVVKTHAGELSVCNTANEELLSIKCHEQNIKIQVFANDESEPDIITILVESHMAE